ncbi:MAG TPA: BPL-N domain-containing protein [Bryobacteraceae bacterium]|nr:BPL-N domain-containing protein [Bryobacteraceae bacterium]
MTTRRRLLILAPVVLFYTACGIRSGVSPSPAPILLFNGTGASPGDVAAVESILGRGRLNYATANSRQLNAMDESRIRAYRLLIVPGGNFIEIGNSLAPDTSAKLRRAVQGGLNYLGICAGAFFAGNSPYNGLDLTSGVRFGFYAAEARGVRKAAVPVAVVGAPTLDQYWEDGPQLSGWGAVVGTYPDGTPAIVEGTFGTGWVVLTGVHPEAPQSWRRGMTFATAAGEDNAYAATLIRAALNREPLARH